MGPPAGPHPNHQLPSQAPEPLGSLPPLQVKSFLPWWWGSVCPSEAPQQPNPSDTHALFFEMSPQFTIEAAVSSANLQLNFLFPRLLPEANSDIRTK